MAGFAGRQGDGESRSDESGSLGEASKTSSDVPSLQHRPGSTTSDSEQDDDDSLPSLVERVREDQASSDEEDPDMPGLLNPLDSSSDSE